MTTGFTELGMTDVASRSRSGFIFKAVTLGSSGDCNLCDHS
ncbi:MAG: hypothetical protein ACJ0BK_01495 [Coraliomargaritaceae bacterium]